MPLESPSSFADPAFAQHFEGFSYVGPTPPAGTSAPSAKLTAQQLRSSGSQKQEDEESCAAVTSNSRNKSGLGMQSPGMGSKFGTERGMHGSQYSVGSFGRGMQMSGVSFGMSPSSYSNRHAGMLPGQSYNDSAAPPLGSSWVDLAENAGISAAAEPDANDSWQSVGSDHLSALGGFDVQAFSPHSASEAGLPLA